MRRNKPTRRAGLARTALLAVAALCGALTAEGAELDTVRQESVTAAQSVQAEERKLADSMHRMDLLRRELDGRQRGLDESRKEQAELLGVLERLSLNPLDRVVLGPLSPLDRVRGRMLVEATVQNLRTEARALADEIARVDTLHAEIDAKQGEVPEQRQALATKRQVLSEIVARRVAITRKLGPDRTETEKRIAKLGRDAADFGQLVDRLEAEADRRDKDQLARAVETASKAKGDVANPVSSDPTRPRDLRAFDADRSVLVQPAAGTVLPGADGEDSPENTRRSVEIGAVPGGIVVAPFDGEVIYSGAVRGHGLSLILRHAGGYHSVLAGLGRLDITTGQWVAAGEPVGAMPDAAGDGAGGKLYIELRREGFPVDPRPWLADGDKSAGRDERVGEQKVRE